MKTRALHLSVVITLMVCFASTGCANDQNSICQSARDLQSVVNEIQGEDLASLLGPEFWQQIDTLLGQLANSESVEIGALAAGLRTELQRLIVRLEAADYNLVTVALDPEAAEQFVIIADDLLSFASGELQTALEEQC